MALPQDTKDRTINIRVSSSDLAVIDRAALLQHKSRSDFLMDAATREAEDVMLNSNIFALSPEAWDEFIALLESPPEPSAALRALFKASAPWE